MSNDLVHTSRAGDVFHYRWAARQCLKMLHPKSTLKYIIIEGSDDKDVGGEYVIDVAEYHNKLNSNPYDVIYYQLKHSIKRLDQPFNLSDLQNTIEGFAKRFNADYYDALSNKFSIITNRPFSDTFRNGILSLSNGTQVTPSFQRTIESYTKLKNRHLQEFCASLELIDSEGDYNFQKYELHAEIAEFIAGSVDGSLVDHVVALVQDPDNFGRRISREEILKRLGVTSEEDLFPAKAEFDELTSPIKREQHDDLLHQIIATKLPIIIHAGGGVGKTVVTRQLADSLPNESVGIVYDCFGSGKYRNISQSRHRLDVALVQIINELASKGLCNPLIPSNINHHILVKSFFSRIGTASAALKKANKDAVLAIFVDAADNAEMAAYERGDIGFIHELLKEEWPDDCRLIAVCRTERIYLLKPSSRVLQIELQPFSENETLNFLHRCFLEATELDGKEFFRLTGGNPRVQANALDNCTQTLTKIFSNLGPSGTTVDQQIAQQLEHAVNKIKDMITPDFHENIEEICRGLAVLPPLIPLDVLAAAVNIDKKSISSFIADLGRPLWLSENAIQFRDEPTETWFRENFVATIEEMSSYITRLTPLSSHFVYVAEVLPSLLLQAERYDELIQLALSDSCLPEDSPIDMRNIRVYRLQFAFKAALKQKRFSDAIKLALRAGEEMAGNSRQIELLNTNLDLIAPLQSRQRVQELAFKRQLRGAWDGSENIYSAALLSTVDDYKGEARGYLRSGHNWLKLYFKERKKDTDRYDQHALEIEDLLEMAYAIFNLSGVQAVVNFLLQWSPGARFKITKLFVKRLIDFGDLTSINEIAVSCSRDQYSILAITHELMSIGHNIPLLPLIKCLDLLSHKKARIMKSRESVGENLISLAVVSFSEACVRASLSKRKVLRVLNYYTPHTASRMAYDSYQDYERKYFLRSAALKAVLLNKIDFDITPLMSPELLEKSKGYDNQDVRNFQEIIGSLYPWYLVRAHVLCENFSNIEEMISDADKHTIKASTHRYREFDRIPHEITRVQFEILSLSTISFKNLSINFLANKHQLLLSERLKAVRAAYRLDHLTMIRTELEHSCYTAINESKDESPETKASWYIELARAVVNINQDDAKVYFDNAIESVSKFGDELVAKWEAIEALAQQTAEGGYVSPELAYRFARCTELIGDNIYKEKYYDRNGALSTLCSLYPPSAFTALSRWRDRDVGFFDRQVKALFYKAIEMKILSGESGWAMSNFFDGEAPIDFIEICLENASESQIGKILDSAIVDYRLSDPSKDSWGKLSLLATRYSHTNPTLKEVETFYAQPENFSSKKSTQEFSSSIPQNKDNDINWDDFFATHILVSADGLYHAIQLFSELPPPRMYINFWIGVTSRVKETEVLQFLNILPTVENIDLDDIKYVFKYLPTEWFQKPSVQKALPRIIRNISHRFAFRLLHEYSFNDFIVNIPNYDEKAIFPIIYQGVIDGITETPNSLNTDSFFCFISFVSSSIPPEDTKELLSFGLERFEQHIENEYADGTWDNWLNPPTNMTETVTGLIWSALGSPRSSMRWKAVHCVRKLAEFDCQEEIDALLMWMQRDTVDSFGSLRFPFYNLHARQYLLIALARITIEKADILKNHQLQFIELAMNDINHILMQNFAADIALAIETQFPGSCSDKMLIDQLKSKGKSPFPIQKGSDGYSVRVDTIWHQLGQVDTSLKLYLAYDFDRYWFEQLGEVFGVSSKQIEDLAREIILKDWKIKIDKESIHDTRQYLWKSSRHERETWHSHFDYPKTDDYSFYLSYHAMFYVATKLLQNMPIIKHRDWCDDCWLDWLQRHSLTNLNNKWLSDFRDPAPLKRREWVLEQQSKNWLNEIEDDDFLDGLMIDHQGDIWLNVHGYWKDNNQSLQETYTITSALVAKNGANSLLNALSIGQYSHEYMLPNYDEEDTDFNLPPFELQGWIYREERSIGIDELDPYASSIPFPAYLVGDTIIQKLKLSIDDTQKKWYLTDNKKPSLIAEIWSDTPPERDELYRSGNRLNASLDVLILLCKSFECELIISVEIDRHTYQRYHKKDSDEPTHSRKHKIYILSPDGKLRDTTTNYSLR